MADPRIVQVASLTHRYGERTALDSVNFDVAQASILGLLGPNGSGKTTLFRILATLATPTSGTAHIAGADVIKDRGRVREILGVVFQSPSLDVQLTVRENLRHQGHLYGLSGRTLHDRARTLMTQFDIADRATDRVAVLSGGLQRRVELAKALLHQPRVLLLDEPSTGLDPAARAGVMDYLHRLRDEQGVTCLITTHLMDEAERCDRIVILDGGKLVAQDTPALLRQSIGGEVLTLGTRRPSALAARVSERFGISAETLEGTVRIERDRGHELVTELIEAFPGEIDNVTVGKPTLDDVFVHLTGHHLGRDAEDDPVKSG
jgi:ABC-2 type transport system ATP-binding protein